MGQALEIHKRLTPIRAGAYEGLFGCKPATVFPYHQFASASTPCLVDVFVYPLAVEDLSQEVFAAVTNGMSDFRMADPTRPSLAPRRELIQYFRICTVGRARALHDAAWLPHVDGFAVDVYDTISLPEPFEGDLQNFFFLRPIWSPHAEFQLYLEGDEMSLLWNVPLTQQELIYKKNHGADALLDRMEEVNLPWWFDSESRPPLIEGNEKGYSGPANLE